MEFERFQAVCKLRRRQGQDGLRLFLNANRLKQSKNAEKARWAGFPHGRANLAKKTVYN